MQPTSFRHVITLTTRFADVDMLGHVNNAKYLTYIEEARIAYAEAVFRAPTDPPDQFMILARTVIDYLLPIKSNQKLNVYTRCSRLGRKSFDLSYMMVTKETEQLVCTSVTTMVGYDYKLNQSMLIPETWRERIMAYEVVKPDESAKA
jgi:acyl-CoA thioester hydrolase